MEPKQVQGSTQLPPTLPLNQQQPALDVKKIDLLKSKIKKNVFEDAETEGKIEIKNGSLFGYIQRSLYVHPDTTYKKDTKIIMPPDTTNKKNIKIICERQSKQYYDTDGNGTFETLIVETTDANGKITKTKYGKSKGHDDNVSNFDIEIPLNGQTK